MSITCPKKGRRKASSSAARNKGVEVEWMLGGFLRVPVFAFLSFSPQEGHKENHPCWVYLVRFTPYFSQFPFWNLQKWRLTTGKLINSYLGNSRPAPGEGAIGERKPSQSRFPFPELHLFSGGMDAFDQFATQAANANVGIEQLSNKAGASGAAYVLMGLEDGCCWETFCIFACCGLVVEIQPLNC